MRGAGIAAVMLAALAGSPVQAQQDDVLPPDYRGNIAYRGTYRGSVVLPSQLIKYQHKYIAAGDIVFVIEYDGDQIWGFTRTTYVDNPRQNMAQLMPGRFIGRRSGDRCDLRWRGGGQTSIRCGKSAVRAEFVMDTPEQRDMKVVAQAQRTAMTDYAERERWTAEGRPPPPTWDGKRRKTPPIVPLSSLLIRADYLRCTAGTYRISDAEAADWHATLTRRDRTFQAILPALAADEVERSNKDLREAAKDCRARRK